MLYIHDVWVNWFDSAVKGYEVPEFEAWKRDDTVELLDQSPLLYLTEEMFDYIENSLNTLPADLLEAIHNKGYMRKNHERQQIDYMAVITDGYRVLIFDTDGTDYPVKKSRPITRQHQLALEMVEGTHKLDFSPPKETEVTWGSVADLICDIEDIHMRGLTRREREMKQILMVSLSTLAHSKSIEEVRYWYTELFPAAMIDITTENWSIEDMVLDMHDHLSEGWDEQHIDFGTKLTRYTKIRDNDWKELHAARVTKVDRTKNR